MDKTLNYLNNLLKPNDKVVIATSTGPDSMFLLHLLEQFQTKLSLQIIIAHVNHNVRKQSQEEEEFIKNYAKEKKLDFELLKITEYKAANFQHDARSQRYEFFYKVVEKYQANYLMTAHHGDDLMETILMRLTRGSSLNGYIGIKKQTKKNKFQIIRPLLYMTKQEIIEYMDKNKLKYYIDTSNSSSKYTRNRYRQEILPFLKQENNDVHLKYLAFSEELEEANNYISKQVQKHLKKVYIDNTLDITKTQNIDNYLLTKIIAEIFHLLYQEELNKINKKHQENLLHLIKTDKASMSISLPNNIIALKEYNKIRFINNKDIVFEKFNEVFRGDITLKNGNKIVQIKSSNKTDNYHLYLNSKDIKLPIIVRSRKPSDKMAVKNLNGSKKVQDILVNEKIAKSQRDALPIVTDSAGNILWIPGIKKSKFDRAKTKNYDIILKYQLKEGKNNE